MPGGNAAFPFLSLSSRPISIPPFLSIPWARTPPLLLSNTTCRPTVQQISKRVQEICRAEGLAVNDATLAALIQSANGGDLRLVIGQLQLIRRRTRMLSYDDVRGKGGGGGLGPGVW